MSDVDTAEDVPEYDNDDPEGDRWPYLDSEEHKDIQVLFPDEELDE